MDITTLPPKSCTSLVTCLPEHALLLAMAEMLYHA